MLAIHSMLASAYFPPDIRWFAQQPDSPKRRLIARPSPHTTLVSSLSYQDRHALQRIPPYHNGHWCYWVTLATNLSPFLLTNICSGVGFGICQRLLSNFLGSEQPVDSLPQALATPGDTLPCPYAPCTRLTIVMACRSKKHGEEAREELLKRLDKEIEYRSKKGSPEQRAGYKKFRETVRLDLLPLELSISSSVLNSCDIVQQRHVITGVALLSFTDLCVRYPYVSHLVFNAGNAPWIGINWLAVILAVMTNLIKAVTYPRFKLQQVGLMSEEGFGYTWMCNVFGHFIMVRLLHYVQHTHSLIRTTGSKAPARPRKEPLASPSPLDDKHGRRGGPRLIRLRRLAIGSNEPSIRDVQIPNLPRCQNARHRFRLLRQFRATLYHPPGRHGDEHNVRISGPYP